jgi:hypothetical protein
MSGLQCQQFQERLNDLLDRRAAPRDDANIARHAKTCPECERWLDTQELVMRSLHISTPCTQSTRVEYPFVTSGRWGAIAAIAATISLCLFAGHQWLNAPETYEVAMVAEPVAIISENVEEIEIPVPLTDTAFRIDGAVESWNEFLASSAANTEWLEPVATPIRPLADSMTSTFNVLRQAIPTGRRIQKPEIKVQESAARFMDYNSIA